MEIKRRMLPAATAVALCALPATAAADETKCTGPLGPVTVDNLLVPSGSTCALDGTQVKGTVKVERDAMLSAHAIRVVGNVQAEGAARVTVGASELGGSLQVKQGGGADVSETRVTGDVQLDANGGAKQRVVSNDVNGSVQVVSNSGGVEISRNLIDGNLQCKENSPPPDGGGNVVQGNAEDQCAGLTGSAPGGLARGDGGSGQARLARTTLRASHGGRVVRVPIRCARGGPRCAGTLRVGARRSGVRFSLAAGGRRHVRVRLARRDRAALRRAGRLRVTVVIATPRATIRRAARVLR